MAGRPKGLLIAPDGVSIVERWRHILSALGVSMVLVGDADAYAALQLPVVHDEPRDIGPLGGLIALLQHAKGRPTLALACDMPFVSRALVERLLTAPADAAIVAPRRDARWEPLCARYDPARVLPLARAQAAAPNHSLQRLLDAAHAVECPMSPEEATQLRDWDTPDDISVLS
jgi:molybdopterin-guanine dinucleotide biosynthesis protein A